jgi:hypothetical protein
MPFGVKEVENGYKVYNKETGKTYSKKPQTLEKAFMQLKIMNAYYNNEINNNKKRNKFSNYDRPTGIFIDRCNGGKNFNVVNLYDSSNFNIVPLSKNKAENLCCFVRDYLINYFL